MSNDTTVFTAEFPRAVRGYAPAAVDDFVRQIGERLDAIQDRLNEKIEASDKLTEELNAVNASLAAFREKEEALAGALVSIEVQRGTLRKELDTERKAAQAEAEAIKAAAKADAEQVIVAARTDSEDILSEVRKQAAEIVSAAKEERAEIERDLTTLSNNYDTAIADIRKTMNNLTASLATTGSFFNGEVIENLAMTTVVEPRVEQFQELAPAA